MFYVRKTWKLLEAKLKANDLLLESKKICLLDYMDGDALNNLKRIFPIYGSKISDIAPKIRSFHATNSLTVLTDLSNKSYNVSKRLYRIIRWHNFMISRRHPVIWFTAQLEGV